MRGPGLLIGFLALFVLNGLVISLKVVVWFCG
jgi:hypothetical protein